MTINTLFEALKDHTEGKEDLVFKRSGMSNMFQKLNNGFFPLGPGILAEGSDVNGFNTPGGIMILGNDFGTLAYLNERCPENSEHKNNPTIRNLRKLPLDLNSTFFTNFYLGVRIEGTNTKRVIPLQVDYKQICYDFFITQLNIINPKIVLCLGHEVRKALLDFNPQLFSGWGPRSVSLKKLYSNERKSFKIDVNDSALGNRKFILIPHPCDTRNFSDEYIQAVRPLLVK